MAKPKDKIRQQIRILDSGDLEARCSLGADIHWRGTAWNQKDQGLGEAMKRALNDLEAHQAETGHKPVPGPRKAAAGPRQASSGAGSLDVRGS